MKQQIFIQRNPVHESQKFSMVVKHKFIVERAFKELGTKENGL
jgi:hypothetical protein